jgi:hypothetical protein
MERIPNRDARPTHANQAQKPEVKLAVNEEGDYRARRIQMA